MAIFQNDFFSSAGQIERLFNVRDTLLSAVGLRGGGVKSNTGVSSVDIAISAVATHPFITAGVLATAINPTSAGTLIKSVATKAGQQFAGAKLTTQAAVVGGGIVGGNVLLSSSKARKGLVDTPSNLAQFGQNIGGLIEDPSLKQLGKIAKDNPILTAGAGLLGIGALGVGAGALANTIATTQNTRAIKQSTLQSGDTPLYPTSVTGKTNLVPPATDSSITPTPIPRAGGSISPRRRRKAKPEPQRVSQSVKVYNIDDRDVSDRKIYKLARKGA